MFINSRVELADAKHPASKFSARHKERFHEMLREIVLETAGAKAVSMAPAIALLVEGAIVTAVMEQSSKPAEVASPIHKTTSSVRRVSPGVSLARTSPRTAP